jgi:hypothetical protein
MPILLNIPPAARLVTFRADTNTPVAAGLFPVNTLITDLNVRLRPNCAYMFTDLTFASNASEPELLKGLFPPAGSGFFTLNLWRVKGLGVARNIVGMVNKAPLVFNLWKRVWACQLFFETAGQNEEPGATQEQLAFQIIGTASQTPGMVIEGIGALCLYFNVSAYEIEDRKFIENFKSNLGKF